MGNPCCSGRAHALKQQDSLSSQLDILDSSPKSLKKKPSKLKKKSKQSLKPSKKIENWKDQLDFNKPSPVNPSNDLEDYESEREASSMNYSESNERAPSKATPQQFERLTYESELSECLKYDLLIPKNLSRAQQLQILSALDQYKEALPEDEQENVDGLAEIIEKGKSKFLMITTHALYVLSSDNFSLVERRILLEDLELVVINKKKDQSLLLVRQDYLENLVFASGKIVDVILSVQQVNFEAFEEYLPWAVYDNPNDLDKLSEQKNMWPKELKSNENLRIFKVIIENGEFPETKVVFEKTSSDTDPLVGFFMMTDLAIYTLGKDYSFLNRVDLMTIDKLIENKKNKMLVIYHDAGVNTFISLSNISQKIQKEAEKLSKTVKIVKE
jgi:hypothetical protein